MFEVGLFFVAMSILTGSEPSARVPAEDRPIVPSSCQTQANGFCWRSILE
jgi:hypothetical protein